MVSSLRSLALLSLVVSAATGQNSSPVPAIAGVIVDPSGASIPEAIVTLTPGASSARQSVKTDVSGNFRFDGLPQGAYSIEVHHEGFKLSITPIRLSTRPHAALRISLALADVASEVSVTTSEFAKVSTDAAENRDSATVDQNLMEKIPVFDQDYLATMSAFLGAGAGGTGGTQLIVDGMQVNSVGVSASAIQEVRINQNPYSAEFARPGRGRIEIITKATTTEYHGTFNFIFRDSSLNARDPFALARSPEQRRIFEGVLTGPVGHSKTTSFLFSGNRQEEDLQSTVFARTLSGLIQETVPSPRRNTELSFRLSHQFTQNHVVSWQYNDRNFPSSNQGVGGFVLPEAGVNLRPWEREVIYNDRWAFSKHWLNQFQILVGRERESTTSVNSAQKLVVQDAFTSGGAQADLLRTENHVQLNEIVSWSSGKHFVKFGLNMPDWSRRGVSDLTNFGGTFYFATLEDYAAQHPYAFRQQQGSGHVVYWQKELGGFVQDDFRLRPNLSLSLGFRYNWQNYLRDNNNFAPRLAFAYAPHRSRKTVFRGGAGIFYDRTGAGPLADVIRYDGRQFRSYLITDPGYPNPFGHILDLDAQPTSIVRFDPAVREPYSIQYSFGIEEQVAKRTTIAATYSGSVGVSLFSSRDVNSPLGPNYLFRPDPTLAVFRQIESAGRQIGNTLDLTLRGDVTRYVTGLMQYTLSQTNNNTGGIGWFPANQRDLSGEWGRADFDQRQRLNLLGSFNPGRLFSLGIGLAIASGKPYSLTTGEDAYSTGLVNARPAGVMRNSLVGPGYADFDLRWAHDFYLNKVKKDKGMVTTIGADAFNVLNHVNYTSYIGNLRSPFFGTAVSAFPTRRLQLGLRFKF